MDIRLVWMLCIAMFFAMSGLAAQSPEWLQASSGGGAGYDYIEECALDGDGNIYVTGIFENSATFGSITLTSFGSYDIFVAKLSPSGNWLWAQNAGSEEEDEYGYGICVDASGACYVTGTFEGTAAFGGVSLVSSGGKDVFVAKLDSAGNWLWAVGAGGTSYDTGYALFLDDSGVIHCAGRFMGTAGFGGFNLISAGNYDVFVARLDSSGNWLSASRGGGSGLETPESIGVDANGNCFLTGYFQGTAVFGASSLSCDENFEDIFVAKMDEGGNWLWAVRAGGSNRDYGKSLALDGSGNCYVTGLFNGISDFGQFSQESAGSVDIFICKLDPLGNWIWVRRAGGPDWDAGMSLCIDASGNLLMTGYFSSTAQFGTQTLTSGGGADIFVAKLHPLGLWIWLRRAGGTLSDYPDSIKTDPSGDIIIAGEFAGTADFGDLSITSYGDVDAFVAKLGTGTQIEDETETPAILFELTASPNPFQNSVSFTIHSKTAATNISIVLFDIKGRAVRTLPCPASSDIGIISWDGCDDDATPCPAGIYLARAVIDGKALKAKKITLIR